MTNALQLTQSEIIELWDMGVWNPLAYVDAAIKYELEKSGETHFRVDVENFIFRWQGVMNPDTGKTKRLTEKQLISAILTLKEKGVLRVKFDQIMVSPETENPDQN